MARQRHPVPAEEPHALLLGQPRPQAAEEALHALGRVAGGVLERDELLDLVVGPQARGRVDEEVVGVLDGTARPDELAQRVHEVGRRLEPVAPGVRLPARDADADAARDALRAEDRLERPGPVARLVGQAEVLEQLAAHRQRCGAGHPEALVADEDRRVAIGPDDEHGLLEARVEAREVREVGAVLAVPVDDEDVEPALRRARPRPLQARGIELGGQLRHALGHAELGQLDGREARARSRRGASHVDRSPELDDLVGIDLLPRPDVAIRPGDAHLGRVALAETEMDRPELAAGMTTADGDLALGRLAARADLDPGADRVAVRAVLVRASRRASGPSTAARPPRRCRRCAGCSTFSTRWTSTRSSRPSALRSTSEAPRVRSVGSPMPARSAARRNVPFASPRNSSLGSSAALSGIASTLPFET